MKLSMADCSIHPYTGRGMDYRTAFTAIRDCGYTCIDYGIKANLLEDDYKDHAKELKSLIDELGLTIPQAHAPNPPKSEKPPIYYLANALRFCKEVGIPAVVVHPRCQSASNTREEYFNFNVERFKSLIPYAEETGVTVLIENIGNYFDSHFLYNGQELRKMVDAVDHPLVAACWDIGHANHFEKKDCNQYDSIVALGEKLVAIHAHDNIGFFTDAAPKKRVDIHTMPYFSGMASVNWDEVLQALKDINYKGTFNFEISTPTPSSKRPDFVYNGEVVHTLEILPLDVWKIFNKGIYETGRFMLESYGLYEE